MSLCSLNTISAIGFRIIKLLTLSEGLMYYYNFETADISSNTLKNNKPDGTYDLTIYSSTSNAVDSTDTTIFINASASLKLDQALPSITPNVIYSCAYLSEISDNNRPYQTIAFKFRIKDLKLLRSFNTLFSGTTTSGGGGMVIQVFRTSGTLGEATAQFRLRYVTYSPTVTTTILDNIQAGTWYSLAITKSVSTLTTYLNGNQIASTNNTGSTIIKNGVRFGIGMMGSDININPSTTGEGFNGNIDDFRIYDRALTIQEIQSIHNSTS